jgi:hypothetical protein
MVHASLLQFSGAPFEKRHLEGIRVIWEKREGNNRTKRTIALMRGKKGKEELFVRNRQFTLDYPSFSADGLPRRAAQVVAYTGAALAPRKQYQVHIDGGST